MRALAFVALAGCLSPSQRTTALALASTATLAADWAQTRGITARCTELNPVLGRCGERFPVDLYFPLVILGHLFLAAQLPPPWQEAFLAGMAGVEGATVWRNAVTR